MTDRLQPVRGYFKIEQIDKDGNTLSTYENQNTVMARIPELLAGQMSGLFTKDIRQYVIGCIALGTDGSYKDSNGEDIPKNVDDARTQMFSEHNFWDTKDKIQRNLDFFNDGEPLEPVIGDDKKRVYQMSFTVAPRGDRSQNPTSLKALQGNTQGCTIPYDTTGDPADTPPVPTYQPTTYTQQFPADVKSQFRGMNSNIGREIRYNFTLDVDAGNNPNNTPVGYNEAALYLVLDAAEDGNPLGQLFSMKTFKPVYKDNTCALRIEWNLFF